MHRNGAGRWKCLGRCGEKSRQGMVRSAGVNGEEPTATNEGRASEPNEQIAAAHSGQAQQRRNQLETANTIQHKTAMNNNQ
ncbi:hypothetical protein AVEN_265648-1 [Araneus ventricosus]|uniref:Uncharacterized protein n=1 Tax=Araneus ventricosus TaxID=182803 RepID=A0A4Y2U237_ARAVE|nr:hypothetical protein AVEN_265648-1 [Araneus ventricosus]